MSVDNMEDFWCGYYEGKEAEKNAISNESKLLLSHRVWKTKEGTPIKINTMETSHIYNTAKMVIRNSDIGETEKQYLYLFLEELKERCKV